MNTSILSHITTTSFTMFKDQAVVYLTESQKKVAVVALAIISAMTLLFVVCRSFGTKEVQITGSLPVNQDDKIQALEDKLIALISADKEDKEEKIKILEEKFAFLTENQHKLISNEFFVSDLLAKTKTKMLADFDSIDFDKLKSVTYDLEIFDEDKVINQTCTIKKLSSQFDIDSIPNELDTILKGIKERIDSSIASENVSKILINWNADFNLDDKGNLTSKRVTHRSS